MSVCLSAFSPCTVNTYPVCALLAAMPFTPVCVSLGALLLKMPPTQLSAEFLSGGHKHQKAVMCLPDKRLVLRKRHSGVSHIPSVVQCEGIDSLYYVRCQEAEMHIKRACVVTGGGKCFNRAS